MNAAPAQYHRDTPSRGPAEPAPSYPDLGRERSTIFSPDLPDAPESPHSGWGRAHWMASARYLLEGVFSHTNGGEGPIKLPRQEGSSYPQENDPPDLFRAAQLEGLVRSLYIAAPLLRNDPKAAAGNISLEHYYRVHLERLIDPSSDEFVPMISEIAGRNPRQTCEFGGLVLAFMTAPKSLWDPLPSAVRDRYLDYFADYGHGRTLPQNWRFFNVMMLSFLRLHGRPIDEKLLSWHLEQLQALYAGDGWYRDGAGFDYYNPWVFHLYGLLWSKWFAPEGDPNARRFDENFRLFLPSYIRLFSRDAQMILWGRSICYRAASVASLAVCGLMDNPPVDLGWARRICSGVLRQFVEHPDFLENRVPSLGAYGPFEPAIQVYSCSASPLWMGLAFLGLTLPKEHAFWTARESNGIWTELESRGGVDSLILEKAGMMITNRGKTGCVELRTGKVTSPKWHYNKLAYHSHLEWAADDPDSGSAASHALQDEDGRSFRTPIQIATANASHSVWYRQATFSSQAAALQPKMDMAEVLVSDGIVRVDRPRHHGAATWRLGHFALAAGPAKTKIERREQGSQLAILADNGLWSLALVAVCGWQSVGSVLQRGVHPSGKDSLLLFAECSSEGVIHPSSLCAVLLQQPSGRKWSDADLFGYHLEKTSLEQFRICHPKSGPWPVNLTGFEGRLQN